MLTQFNLWTDFRFHLELHDIFSDGWWFQPNQQVETLRTVFVVPLRSQNLPPWFKEETFSHLQAQSLPHNGSSTRPLGFVHRKGLVEVFAASNQCHTSRGLDELTVGTYS